MAPESERANVKHTDECSAQALTTCKCGALQRALREQNEQIAKQYGIDLNNLPELPNEPTLTCSELEAENLRVRGLLQRVNVLSSRLWSMAQGMDEGGDVEELALQLETLAEQAESADIGKLDTADKSGKVNRVEEKRSVEMPREIAFIDKDFSQRKLVWRNEPGSGIFPGYYAEGYEPPRLNGKDNAAVTKPRDLSTSTDVSASAETGGEKAVAQQFCRCANDWTDGTGWCQECHLERKSREPEKLNNDNDGLGNRGNNRRLHSLGTPTRKRD